MSRLLSFALLLAALLVLGPASAQAPKAARWYVYSDAGAQGNHGEWTNFMPKEAGKMVKLSLVHEKNPFAGTTCIRVNVVKWIDPNWCGVAVSCLPDYWGDKPGKAFDLSGKKKLVFHARGERGGERIQIKVAITGDKKFGDSARLPAATSWLTLTNKWQKFELDLSETDLSRVVTPLCFVTSKDYNRGPITFYLDEIYME